MFKTVEESSAFVHELDKRLPSLPGFPKLSVKIVVFPPFTSLYTVRNISQHIHIGAQNFHYEEQGAFTGEISPLMLKDLVQYVLIGHSERRALFHEKDEEINRKVKTALNHGFTPVLCVGESLEERNAGQTFSKVENQLEKDLEGLSPEQVEKVVIAYEPIWAIGTGVNATPGQAQEVHAFIRDKIIEKNPSIKNFLILYGGSVKPQNSYDLLSQDDINGVLIGGASLKIDDFFAIIEHSYCHTN